MQINPHPGLRVTRLTIGAERAPLLVIDSTVADPDRLLRRAAQARFVTQGSMFPGVRAPAPLRYGGFLEALLNPLLLECFDLQPGRFSLPLCHFSLVTVAPQALQFLQRVPHIDSTSAGGLATVHYLFRGDWGGTAFYRHRQTGFERIDAARRDAYFHSLEQESRAAGTAEAGYIGGDTPLFERVAKVDAAFNRMIVYPRNSLHSGSIDNARVPPADVLGGRLSINSFIDVSP